MSTQPSTQEEKQVNWADTPTPTILTDSKHPPPPPLSSTPSKLPLHNNKCTTAIYNFIKRGFAQPNTDTGISLALILLCPLVYGVLFFSMGTAFLPGNPAWCTLLLWASAQVGAIIATIFYLPRVLGMLVAGLLLENIPWSAIDAFPSKWGVQMRAAALATIFLRCGLELDFNTMRRFKYPATRLALVPGITEALYDAGLGVAMFNMPFLLALTMGFILKAVGPGLVVPAMFRLQKTRLGTDQGIPATVVIAASFDDIIAITGYSIFSSLAITSDGSESDNNDVAWEIAKGPVQVIFGILGGLIFGICLGFTKIFDTRVKRLIATYGSALLLMFFLEYFDLLSGGALASLFVGLVASNAWEKGFPRFGSMGKSFTFSPELERFLNVVWIWVMEPMLFSTIGAAVNFSALASGTILRSIIIVCTGAIVRIIVSVLSMMGFGYTWREKIFYGIAWTPKATVQAALSAAPLDLIQKLKGGATDYDEWVQWGNDILTTGVFAIIICGTLGVTAIHLFSPKLLQVGTKNDDDSSSSGSEGGGEEGAGDQDDHHHHHYSAGLLPPNAPPTAMPIGGTDGGIGNGAQAQDDPHYHHHYSAGFLPPNAPPTAMPIGGGSGKEGRERTAPTTTKKMKRVQSGDNKKSFDASNNNPSVRSTSAQGYRGLQEEDQQLLAEYMDAIRHLTLATTTAASSSSRGGGTGGTGTGGGGLIGRIIGRNGGGTTTTVNKTTGEVDWYEIQRLSDHVMLIQERLETEIGRREPSVRELFRTASRLAAQGPIDVVRYNQNVRLHGFGAVMRRTVSGGRVRSSGSDGSLAAMTRQEQDDGGGGDDNHV
jgi:Kef-type K+ transport system membrane component KefB